MPRRSARRAAAACLAALAAVASSCGGDPQPRAEPQPTPEPLPPAAAFVAPSGKDTHPCTKAKPCASFDRAYRLAQPGDHVEIAAGRYPSQRIYPDETKQSPRDVVFRPAAGAQVTVKRYLSPWASHVTVRDMVAEADLFIVGERMTGVRQRDVTAIGITAAGLQIDGASEVRIEGGSFGGTPERPTTWNSGIRRSTKTMPSDITIEGASFHDVRCARDEPNCHIECLIVGAVDGLTIRNSVFYGCAVMDIFFEDFNGPISNLVIENNFMADATEPTGGPGTGRPTILFKGAGTITNSLVRFNSLNGPVIYEEGGNFVDARVMGNVIAPNGGSCNETVLHMYNVFAPGGCGPGDQTVPSVDALWVSPTSDATLDYHVKPGARPIDRIPLTAGPDLDLATDIDGQARPIGFRRDAGADEFG